MTQPSRSVASRPVSQYDDDVILVSASIGERRGVPKYAPVRSTVSQSPLPLSTPQPTTPSARTVTPAANHYSTLPTRPKPMPRTTPTLNIRIDPRSGNPALIVAPSPNVQPDPPAPTRRSHEGRFPLAMTRNLSYYRCRYCHRTLTLVGCVEHESSCAGLRARLTRMVAKCAGLRNLMRDCGEVLKLKNMRRKPFATFVACPALPVPGSAVRPKKVPPRAVQPASPQNKPGSPPLRIQSAGRKRGRDHAAPEGVSPAIKRPSTAGPKVPVPDAYKPEPVVHGGAMSSNGGKRTLSDMHRPPRSLNLEVAAAPPIMDQQNDAHMGFQHRDSNFYNDSGDNLPGPLSPSLLDAPDLTNSAGMLQPHGFDRSHSLGLLSDGPSQSNAGDSGLEFLRGLSPVRTGVDVSVGAGALSPLLPVNSFGNSPSAPQPNKSLGMRRTVLSSLESLPQLSPDDKSSFAGRGGGSLLSAARNQQKSGRSQLNSLMPGAQHVPLPRPFLHNDLA